MRLKHEIGKYVPDSLYLRRQYKKIMGKPLNLNNPHTFNEKLQWLKIHDRNPLYTTMVDKYAVKKYVADMIGEEYIIPTLGVWDKFDDINFDELPYQFVLKCTHDSGGLVICKDKSKLDMEKAKEKIEKSLKTNYYLLGREWPYKNVQRRIIAEKYMVDYSGNDLSDYKVHCFNGVPKVILVCSERFSDAGLHEDFYDVNWKRLDVKRPDHPSSDIEQPEPKELQKMLLLSEQLSRKYPFMRTDFYEVNGRLYFGEITFYPASGFDRFEPEEWDYKFGEWLSLPKSIGGYLLKTDCFRLWLHEDDLQESETNSRELTDYKFFCFNGKVDCVMVCIDRQKGDPKFYFFDKDWHLLRYNIRGKNAPENFTLPKPDSMDEMFQIAGILSRDKPFTRIDLYNCNGHIYFGEITFFPDSGFDKNLLPETDAYWGKMIQLDGGKVK